MLKQILVGTLFLPLLALVSAGCGQDSYYEEEACYDDSPQPEQRDNSREEAARLLSDLKSRAAGRSADYREMQRLAWQIDSLAPDSEEASSAKNILKTVKADHDKLAEDAYKQILDSVMDHADKEEYAEGMRLLEKFITEHSGSEAADKAHKASQNISKAMAARSAYERFVNKVTVHREVGEYSQALEYIKQQQPQGLEGTPYEDKLREFMVRFRLEAEGYEDRLAKEKSLPWEDLTKFGRSSWDSNGGSWDSGSGRIQGVNDSRQSALFMIRQGDWKDYVIDLQFTFKGSGFDLWLRGIEVEQTEWQRMQYGPRRTYRSFDVCSGLKNPGGTVEMKVTVRRDMVTIESPSLSEPRYVKVPAEYSYGPLAIALNGGSQVDFTRFRVKHLDKVSAPTVQKDK